MFINDFNKCSSKKKYDSFVHANKVADLLFSIKGEVLYVYKCEICKHHHLTKRKNYFGIDRKKGNVLEMKIRQALRRRE